MRQIQEKLRNLLVSYDAFDEPFRPAVESRLLLFPTDGFLLSPRQFEALGTSAGQVGDITGYCAITEGLDTSEDQDITDFHRFRLDDYASYRALRDSGRVLEENVLTSERGLWAVVISQEFHALLGCPYAFSNEFIRLYPEGIEDFDRFVEAWKSNAKRIGSDISWLPRLTAHLDPDEME